MTALTQHNISRSTKLLFIGLSGSGKTGALASLASAGYNLRILDLDNGIDVLKSLLTDTKSTYDKAAADRVKVKTLTEKMRLFGGKIVPANATVWTKIVDILSAWTEDDGTKLGSIMDWTEQDILVVDTLTTLSNAAFNQVMALNGKLGQTVSGYERQRMVWGAQDLIESFLQMICCDAIKCNVIVNSHIKYVEDKEAPKPTSDDVERIKIGFPSAIGSALPPKVSTYFNNILIARQQGDQRFIQTKTLGTALTKSQMPFSVRASYPIATGLADYFKEIRGDAKL